MGWEDDLFAYLDDLEGRAAALFDAERAEELVDRGRAEYREVMLGARLAASVGRDIGLELLGVGRVTGRLERVAAGWCLIGSAGQDWVVRLAAVACVYGASERALPEVAWSPTARLGLGSALRRVADAEEPCVVHLSDGRRHDGTLQRVGGDFVEVAEGVPAHVVLVAFEAIVAVQSRR